MSTKQPWVGAWAALLVASIVASALAMREEAAVGPAAPAALRPLFAEDTRVDGWVEIEGERAGEPGTRRRGEGWSEALRDALRLFRNARLERVVDPAGAEPGRYGLTPPRYTFRVVPENEAVEPLVLEVGDRAPDQMSVYVRVRRGTGPAGGIAKLPAYQIENLVAICWP